MRCIPGFRFIIIPFSLPIVIVRKEVKSKPVRPNVCINNSQPNVRAGVIYLWGKKKKKKKKNETNERTNENSSIFITVRWNAQAVLGRLSRCIVEPLSRSRSRVRVACPVTQFYGQAQRHENSMLPIKPKWTQKRGERKFKGITTSLNLCTEASS